MQAQNNAVFDPSQLPPRFMAKIAIADSGGCWEWTGARWPRGYGEVNMAKRPKLVHRVVYEMLIGPIPDRMEVCHHCDNPPCCNPVHLFIGTHADNMRDKVAKGRGNYAARRSYSGEQNSRAILTETSVLDIRARYQRGVVTLQMLGDEYGVSMYTIHDIVCGKSWRHIS